MEPLIWQYGYYREYLGRWVFARSTRPRAVTVVREMAGISADVAGLACAEVLACFGERGGYGMWSRPAEHVAALSARAGLQRT